MTLSDIPTQATKIFIVIKQGRNRQNTRPTNIVKNAVQWDEDLTIECRIPSKPPSKKGDLLRFSFRLEDKSVHKHVRYGFCEFDLTNLQNDIPFTFSSILEDCHYHTSFQCDIQAHLNKTIEEIPELPFQEVRRVHTSDSMPLDLKPHSNGSCSSQDDDIEHDYHAQRDNMIFVLPFQVNPAKMEDLKKQVDDVINNLISAY
ncbi:hypothetical protein GPJ56_006331 [Histomonas meleagridis]|uniref:uncharacterized protein n=1 Tax=Histomonas meleagridis TaxID=135588 RepID=UPI00355ABB77|nr:hypothetical protein GPJ56_006331 [Histomonas meleagridis]KAH0796852.1 hypothetical protein GO595_010745 [Histomonas meleagridis]